jgi:hypothetical protein
VEIRRIAVKSQPGQIVVQETLSQKTTFTTKGWWSGSRCRPWIQAPVPQGKKNHHEPSVILNWIYFRCISFLDSVDNSDVRHRLYISVCIYFFAFQRFYITISFVQFAYVAVSDLKSEDQYSWDPFLPICFVSLQICVVAFWTCSHGLIRHTSHMYRKPSLAFF